ncbi:PA1571 family protein [Pseudomonas sp. NPDC089406]|uniref:PA1571 family protein n=1 Tax=Pseudomonas sp. NPDC089406 TaxID=3364463 RepID=UPI003850FB51
MRRQDMSLQHSNDTTQRPQPQVCGSIIDAQGREVPITEQMIQKACKELEASRVKKVQKG